MQGHKVSGGLSTPRQGEGPEDSKLFAKQMTQMALGGAGVERNGTESPGHLMPLLRIPYALLRNCEIITGITGGIYPDRAAKQQTPVKPVSISKIQKYT